MGHSCVRRRQLEPVVLAALPSRLSHLARWQILTASTFRNAFCSTMMLSRFARQLAPRTAALSTTTRLAGLRSSRHLSTLTNQDLKASHDADTANTSAGE